MARSSVPSALLRQCPEGLQSRGYGGSENEEETPVSRVVGEEEVEKVYVAVPEEFKEGKETVLWVLRNTSRDNELVLLHIHRPPQLIPILGGKFPASQVGEERVRLYREEARKKLEKSLEEYLLICSESKFRAMKLVFEMDDIADGIVELVADKGITKLVMGAAADKHYSRKMALPKSKTAISVQQKANLTCKIWFICNGQPICTRDASIDGAVTPCSSTTSSTSHFSRSENLRSRSLPEGRIENTIDRAVTPSSLSSDKFAPHGRSSMLSLPFEVSFKRPSAMSDQWKFHSKSSQISNHSKEILSSSSTLSICSDLEVDDLDLDVYERLLLVHSEAENLKHEAYRETCKRQNAERAALDAVWKAKNYASQHNKELKQRKKLEKMLANEAKEKEILKNERDKYLQGLQKARQHQTELENRASRSECMLKEYEEKLSEAQTILQTLRTECEDLKQAREDAVHEAQELRVKIAETCRNHNPVNFSVFAYSELAEATHIFDDSHKIGEGGYGSVYKGFLCHTAVAIKMLNPKGCQGQAEFLQELEILSSVRHPHLVTLIGTCPEAWALVYEYLPQGSLDSHLVSSSNSYPLHWRARIRIAAEVCSALIFLHSIKPHGIVHGDVKPANILLDANLVSKLGDFGISRLLAQFNATATPCCHTTPKGTLVYTDPEFITSGEITFSADVYSFGIILLRLLTGKPALGIIKLVNDATKRGELPSIVDSSAGDWPLEQVNEVTKLALRCCDPKRKNRPDLAKEVWKVLEKMLKVKVCNEASSSMSNSLKVHSITK